MTKEERKQIKREEALEELIIAIEDFLKKVAIILVFISIAILSVGEMRVNNLELENNARKYSNIQREIIFLDPFENITVYAAELEEFQELQVENTTNVTVNAKSSSLYQPSEEERLFAYKVAYAEARGESSLGQTLIINVAINNMKRQGLEDLIQEFTASGRYESVVDGNVYVGCGKNKVLVTDQDITDKLKQAVDSAFEKDYSEELLKKDAESKGITDSKQYKGGACYFYNPETISKKQESLREGIQVKFQYGNHVFYRYW